MNFSDNPPTYEESNIQYKSVPLCIKNDSFTITRGPDAICVGKTFVIADFIPWSEWHSYEDIGYLLLRTNNWLKLNPHYSIGKCEMIPRMINSKGTLEVSNCYIFNMSYGRRFYINQLRLHARINELKMEPDQICLQTIIPELILERPNKNENVIFMIRRLRTRTDSLKFQEMEDVIKKLNISFEDGSITGDIINISTFYLNIIQYLLNPNTELKDNVCFYEEANQGKCHLRCLRVFYKPGEKIHGNIEFKSFADNSNSISTLDDLINSALQWIHIENDNNFISMEVSQEYAEKQEFGVQQIRNSLNSMFTYSDKCTTLTRSEVVNLFYFAKSKHVMKSIGISKSGTNIIWITPRKNNKKIYETYNSFMDYVGFVLANYAEHILDVETVMIPNPLSWSTIRHQTLKRYFSENMTNYHIYVFKLIVTAGAMSLPLKGAPDPYVSPTKYSTTCTAI